MKIIAATLLAVVMLTACDKEPAGKMSQEEIDKINARLWQFENKPLPPPREKKPGQF